MTGGGPPPGPRGSAPLGEASPVLPEDRTPGGKLHTSPDEADDGASGGRGSWALEDPVAGGNCIRP